MVSAKFRIEKNVAANQWLKIIRKIVDETHWEYSAYDYDVNLKCLDYTVYFAIENATNNVAAIVSLTKVPVLTQSDPARTLSIIGCFYVLPEYRSRKVGLWLFEEMLKDTSDDCFLVGVPSMWTKYRDRFGFDKIPSCTNDNYSANCCALKPEKLRVDSRLKAYDWREVNFKKVCAFDAKISLSERAKYLASTFNLFGSVGKVALNENGEVVGVCRIRLMLNGHVDIGPFYANDKTAASTVLRSCVEAFLEEYSTSLDASAQVHCKVPSPNKEARSIFIALIDGAPYEMHSSKLQYTRKILEIPYHLVYSRFESTDLTTV